MTAPLLDFTVPGLPYPLKRSRRNGVHDYDPPENVDAKWRIRKASGWIGTPHEGPVNVKIGCYYTRKTPTADVDNLAKTVLDALNKWVLKDDRQVQSLEVWKRGSQATDATFISVTEAL